MKEEVKYIPLSEIEVGAVFKAPDNPQPSKEELKRADDWWNSLTNKQKCLIYWGFLEAQGE